MPTADQLIDLIRPDFDALNELLISQLGSEIDLIEEVSQYLIQSGGKRVRPLVTFSSVSVKLSSTLTDENVTSQYLLTTELFHAKALTFRIAAVPSTAARFLVSHLRLLP